MALVSALLGGATGFVSFLIALFLLNISLGAAAGIYAAVALISTIGLNAIALIAAAHNTNHSPLNQYS